MDLKPALVQGSNMNDSFGRCAATSDDMAPSGTPAGSGKEPPLPFEQPASAAPQTTENNIRSERARAT